MRNDDLIPPDASLSYNDWYSKIGSGQVAMAFCGSDALALPVSTFNFPLDQFAFVPMPTGDGVSRYSLYGGTPYVFSANATDEQVKGALLFLKYMGRSPEIDDISLEAMELGFQTAQAKAMPILPTIKAWADPDYLEVANELEEKYINVNMDYFRDFFDTIEEMKKPEEPHYCQDMYGLLDNAIQSILSNPVADPLSELTIANNQFQKNFLSKINK
jgi:ABC-type glycerol-3-phosphate transport system substrate-binding protein